MSKALADIEPAYAAHKVAQIDNELRDLAARKKELDAQRKLYAPHLPKKKND